MDHIESPQAPTGPWRVDLTPEQAALAGRLQARAEQLRNASAAGLSWRDAVDLAAVQMGVAQ
ncbi:hypothetical protein [Streptomyces sp. CB03911]|uniref:hypothetical protein n=1 Tax=Streptomyces sp. CB03911 TaxID=1804758 RepID=UPI00093F1EB8|nr:hypothetical protein [Streptomyces sp. CB03911]OKI16547.1 hypothetical protein A6A07_11090 [Streptomyces sp. CB03911]